MNDGVSPLKGDQAIAERKLRFEPIRATVTPPKLSPNLRPTSPRLPR